MLLSFLPFIYPAGDIAQLARASALQAEGQGFESPYLHKPQPVTGKTAEDLDISREGKRRKRRSGSDNMVKRRKRFMVDAWEL